MCFHASLGVLATPLLHLGPPFSLQLLLSLDDGRLLQLTLKLFVTRVEAVVFILGRRIQLHKRCLSSPQSQHQVTHLSAAAMLSDTSWKTVWIVTLVFLRDPEGLC